MTRYYLMTQYDESEPRCWALAHLPAPWSSFWTSWTWARAEAHPQLPWLWTEAFNWNLSRTHSTFDSFPARIVSHLLCSFISLWVWQKRGRQKSFRITKQVGSLLNFNLIDDDKNNCYFWWPSAIWEHNYYHQDLWHIFPPLYTPLAHFVLTVNFLAVLR